MIPCQICRILRRSFHSSELGCEVCAAMRATLGTACERGIVGTRLVCGYLRKGFLMNGAEVAALRQLILECAAGHQLSVHAIYVDELDTAPDQLVECLAAVP